MSSEFQRLLSIKKTQLKMILDRGYNIKGEEHILDMGESDFIRYLIEIKGEEKRSVRSLLTRFYVDEKDQQRSILVYYADHSVTRHKKGQNAGKIRLSTLTEHVREYVRLLVTYMPAKAIIILGGKIAKQARDFMIKQLIGTRTQQEMFIEEDMTYNPTEHVDVSIHELIPANEVPQKLLELKASLTLLNLIRSSDPIAKYYGWTPGNLIRIYRNDEVVSILAPKSVNYRIVVD